MMDLFGQMGGAVQAGESPVGVDEADNERLELISPVNTCELLMAPYRCRCSSSRCC